jgi:hypothetical protein
MKTLILIVILAVILGSIVYYLYRCKKRGQGCVGCPYAKACGGKCHGGEEVR